MGRKKRYEERVGLTLSTSMLEQIDARRKENEPRLDWIRDAIELRLEDESDEYQASQPHTG